MRRRRRRQALRWRPLRVRSLRPCWRKAFYLLLSLLSLDFATEPRESLQTPADGNAKFGQRLQVALRRSLGNASDMPEADQRATELAILGASAPASPAGGDAARAPSDEPPRVDLAAADVPAPGADAADAAEAATQGSSALAVPRGGKGSRTSLSTSANAISPNNIVSQIHTFQESGCAVALSWAARRSPVFRRPSRATRSYTQQQILRLQQERQRAELAQKGGVPSQAATGQSRDTPRAQDRGPDGFRCALFAAAEKAAVIGDVLMRQQQAKDVRARARRWPC
jgi:hypothetical protein